MNDNLTVPTHFGDLSELSAGLADRVDEERIILYGPTAFEEGSTVSFSILLVDGTPALEGLGRVAAAVDGGEDRAPETRFDIVFDSLQLEGRSEVVYERIVLARQSLIAGEPPTGEIDVSELEEEHQAQAEPAAAEEAYEEVAEDVVTFSQSEAPPPAEEPAEEYAPAEVDAEEYAPADVDVADVDVADVDVDLAADVAADVDAADVDAADVDAELDALDADVAFDDFGGEEIEPAEGATMVASMEEIERASAAPPSAPPPELPEAPSGFALPPLPEALTRPVHPPTWWPAEVSPAEPRPSSGHFQHGGELPVPAEPPRPDLDPTQRVSPAPRPGAEAAPNMPPRDEADAIDEAPMDETVEASLDQTVEASLDHYADDDSNEEAAEPAEASDEAADDVVFEDEGIEVGGFDEPEDDDDATAHEVSLPEAELEEY